MEAKEKQFIVTEKWLEENGALEAHLQAFKQHFPNGGEALEVLEWCGKLNYRYFGEWLVNCLPPIFPPLVLGNFFGNLFYPGDVHIEDDIFTYGLIHIKGSLKVDGKLTVIRDGKVYTYNDINANMIEVKGDAYIHAANIKADSMSVTDFTLISDNIITDYINISKFSSIFGNIKAKIVRFKTGYDGYISGSVDADEIINDGGLIKGDVNTFTIENINGGRVKGKISYKSPDEHK